MSSQTRMLIVAAILGGGAFGACSNEEAAPQVEVTPPEPEAAPGPEREPEPEPITVSGSIAVFKDGHLHVCMHRSLTIDTAVDREKSMEASEEFARQVQGGVAENEDWSLVESCDQFSDRTTWATCTMAIPTETEGLSASLTMLYFDWATVYETDREMRDCLGRMNGRWSAVERGSPEWRDGRRANAMRHLDQATERLNR